MDKTEKYFLKPTNIFQRQYEVLRAFYLDKKSVRQLEEQFGYTPYSIYSLIRDFKKSLSDRSINELFFAIPQYGRKLKPNSDKITNLIIALRKKYLSVDDIKTILDSQGVTVSETYIYHTIKKEGFARLPKRDKIAKIKTSSNINIEAPPSMKLKNNLEIFNTDNAALLWFMSYIKLYNIDKIIMRSDYPETKTLPRLNSILSFVALKLSNISRYSRDDLWCMDRGLGLFAGLNVLPKSTWFTSYSHRVTSNMNLKFLRELNKLWIKNGLLSDTANLDFTTIPYWGNDSHLENNWSGTRHQALSSILAAVAHDPDSGLITYGNTNVRHNNEKDVVVEFLDFYKQDNKDIKYLIFDSRFTTYENLRKLDDNNTKFITIRRRGKNIVGELEKMNIKKWKKVRIPMGNGKSRKIEILDSKIFLNGYKKEIRQIAITGNGKIKPALIITNDFKMNQEQIIKKYAQRWLVEKTISEQKHFFHLNRVSSSMVIKVDFDLTMTILAYNLYRLFARDLPGYSHNTASTLYDKFIRNSGKVKISEDSIEIFIKKKRNLPALLSIMNDLPNLFIPWLNNKKLLFSAASYS